MKTVSILIAFAAILTTQLSAQAAGPQNTTKEGLGLHGYDPVSYFSNAPQAGSSRFTAEHNGVTYRFVDAANRDAFTADPDRYAPQYGGHCAYAMLEGDLVDIDPEKYKIIDGKLYVFYNGFFANTLKQWNKQAEKRGDAALVMQADSQWQKRL